MPHRRNAAPPSIGDECEAFLHGGSLQLHEAALWPIPLWARLNRLSRASLDDLTELATSPIPRRRRVLPMSWDTALILLARQLIADVDSPDQLHARQKAVLHPLEPRAFDNGPIELRPDEFFDFVSWHMSNCTRDDSDRR